MIRVPERFGSSLVNDDVSALDGTTGAGAPSPRSSLHGPILIVAAVAIGFGLYLIVHHSGAASISTGTRSTGTVATTPTTPPTVSTGGLPASEVRLVIINASGVSGAGSAKATTLGAHGYPIVATVNSAVVQHGSTVSCKTALSKEATALAKAVGPGTIVKPFPNPPPAIAPILSCLVTVGA